METVLREAESVALIHSESNALPATPPKRRAAPVHSRTRPGGEDSLRRRVWAEDLTGKPIPGVRRTPQVYNQLFHQHFSYCYGSPTFSSQVCKDCGSKCGRPSEMAGAAIPGTWEYVPLQGKGSLEHVIELRILR